MKTLDTIVCLVAGLLFLISLSAYIYVRLKIRPADDTDDYYYEFEDQQPAYARYIKWTRITFTGIVISVLLMFLAMIL